MKIRFVNHSGFIVEHKGIQLLCDPWIEGKVFNNAWSLISKTKLGYEDFRDINYIWFSHEHPDHFFPPNLFKIPLEARKNITILYQKTEDKRVLTYCKSIGFKDVIELGDDSFNLSEGFSVVCRHFKDGDSWIQIKTPETTLLNLNDCGVDDKKAANDITSKVGEVDVLLTQFSYAYWAGNKEDVDYRKSIADEKLKILQFQCEAFRPKIIIPIASYIYFCHEENFYTNDSINTVRKTYDFLKKNVAATPVVLYNGEDYAYPETHDSESSIKKYDVDLKDCLERKDALSKTQCVNLDQINQLALLYYKKLKEYPFYVRLLFRIPIIYLIDLQSAWRLNLKSGLEKVSCSLNESDVALSSGSLAFCLQYPYGLETISIGAMLQMPPKGNYSKFYTLFRFEVARYQGEKTDFFYLIRLLLRKIKKLITKAK